MKIKKYLKPPPSYLLCQPMKMKLTGHIFPSLKIVVGMWHTILEEYMPQSLHIGLFWPFTKLPFGTCAIYFDLKVCVPTLILNHGLHQRGKLYNHNKTFQKSKEKKDPPQRPSRFWTKSHLFLVPQRKGFKAMNACIMDVYMYVRCICARV